MPRVRYTAEGGHFRVGGYGFDPGDEHDVDADLAEYLADHEDFEVLEELGAEDDADEEEEVDLADVDDEVEGLIDEFDEELWLDRDYQDRERLVETGLFDSHLEAIADVETSDTVIGAVDDRLDELEG